MARLFDGVNDQIVWGSDASNDNLAAFTAYALVNIGVTISAEQPILMKQDSGFLGKSFLFFGSTGNNVLVCYLTRTGGNDCYAFSNINAVANSTWTVVVSTWAGSGNVPKIYTCAIGGTLTEVTYASTNIGSGTFGDDSAATLRYGARDSADIWFAHTLADFGLWSRVLNGTELADLGLGKSPEFISSGLVKASRINGSDSPEIDFVGGTNGTVTGTTFATHPSVIYPSSYVESKRGIGRAVHRAIMRG